MKSYGRHLYLTSKIISVVCIFAVFSALASCGDSIGPCEHTYINGKYETSPYGHELLCDSCGEPRDKSEPHKFCDMVTLREPSEGADGAGYRECYTCHYRVDSVIHDFKKVDRQSSTCYTAGNEEHYVCASCGKLFDKYQRETDESGIRIAPSSHSAANPNPKVLAAPTPTEAGKVRFLCDNSEKCGGYIYHNKTLLEVTLPPLGLNESYTVISKEGSVYVLSVKASYIEEQLTSIVSADTYRRRLASAVSELEFVYSACEAGGHSYSPTSFEERDGRLYFICESDRSHELEIALPDISDSIYSTTRCLASCVRPAGVEYTLSVSNWLTVLEAYSGELVSDEYTLNDFASALRGGFCLFISGGGEPDPDNHIHNDNVRIEKFTAPTYDIFTNVMTVGSAECACSDCNRRFTVSVEYGEGVWRRKFYALEREFYRDYTIYGKVLSAPMRKEFNYVIDTNGGAPVSPDVTVSGSVGSATIRIIDDNFVRDGWYVSGVTVYVDRKYSDSDQVRVTEKTGWLPNHGFDRTYWDVSMDSDDYMGDVEIVLQWHAS